MTTVSPVSIYFPVTEEKKAQHKQKEKLLDQVFGGFLFGFWFFLLVLEKCPLRNVNFSTTWEIMIKTSTGEEMTGSIAAWLKSQNTFNLVTALITA